MGVFVGAQRVRYLQRQAQGSLPSCWTSLYSAMDTNMRREARAILLTERWKRYEHALAKGREGYARQNEIEKDTNLEA